ncbi:MAG: DUF4189 domain-containing protein [Burkholderiales bacterium]|nr:DUF4189 domain-containing protein [Burkholderiales bacterium]
MKRLTIAACAALLAAQVHAAKAKKPAAYGAIAYHRATQAWGTSHAARSDREARVGALERCGERRCEVVIAIRNACGALADGPRRPATASGATRAEAEAKALRKCASEACRIVAWACTP